ncbi:MAG: hypothetical protein WCR52_12330 [Bacteroidota bacterium]
MLKFIIFCPLPAISFAALLYRDFMQRGRQRAKIMGAPRYAPKNHVKGTSVFHNQPTSKAN